MPIYLEIVLVFGLILANGVFAASEIAVVTARRGRLRRKAEEGARGARAALQLAAEPTDFLSTIQVGITLVGIMIGAVGGASFSGPLAQRLAEVPALEPYARTLGYVLVVAITTYLTLIFGELVPKRLAMGAPERLASGIARPMRLLSRIASPLVALLSASTEAVAKLLGRGEDEESPATEEDIRSVVAQATKHGTMHRSEAEIVDEVLHLGDRRLAAIATPREEIEWIDLAADERELRHRLREARHSRLLACEGSLDRVVGVIHTRDALRQCLGDGLDLRGAAYEPLTASADMRLLRAVELLRATSGELVLMRDGAGKVQGIVTMADVVGNLLTDLPGHVHGGSEDLQRRDDGSVLVDGGVPLSRVAETMEVDAPAFELAGSSRSVADFLRARLEGPAQVGDVVDRWGLQFEIVDMDGRRIDRVLVTHPPKPGEEEEVEGEQAKERDDKEDGKSEEGGSGEGRSKQV